MQVKGKEDRLKTPKHRLQESHNVQMPKRNRTDCKNGKQTNLLVQGERCYIIIPNNRRHKKLSANNKSYTRVI